MTFLFVWPSCDSWRLGGINCYPLRLSQMAPRRLGIDLFCTFFLSFFFIFFLFTSLCRLLCSFTYIPVCSAVVFSGRTKKIWRGRHKGTCAFIFFCLFHPFSSDSWYSCYSVNLWRFWHSFNLISARFKTLSNVGPLMWSITWFHSTFNATESLLENVWIPEDSLQFRPSWKIGLKLGWNLRGRGWDLNSFK